MQRGPCGTGCKERKCRASTTLTESCALGRPRRSALQGILSNALISATSANAKSQFPGDRTNLIPQAGFQWYDTRSVSQGPLLEDPLLKGAERPLLQDPLLSPRHPRWYIGGCAEPCGAYGPA